MPAMPLMPLASSSPCVHPPAPVDSLPAFPDPRHHDPALEAFLQAASSQLCRWLGQAAASSPLPALARMPAVAPEAGGLGPERLLADLQLVMEGAYNPGHPGAMAHLDPPALASSLAADLICAGLNNNLLAEELSPSLSRLEQELCAWLARRLGLPQGAGGVAASGGSLSNLMALVTARRRSQLHGCSEAVVVASVDAHVSLAKALMVMGLSPSALVTVPVDAEGRLDAEALADTLASLEASGRPVIAVVATAGTTVRGAVDPLVAIARLCRRHGIWLHVDGAIGAVFGLAPDQAGRVADLGLADSLTVNPQKLLGITKTSSLLLLAQPSLLLDTFATGLPYMESSVGAGHGGEAGLQGTRPAEILKLWLGLRHLGESGIAALVDGAIARRRRLAQLLTPLTDLDLLNGSLHLLAFRPRGLSMQACERWSLDTREALLARQLMLSRPFHHGRHHLKAVLGNPHTGEDQLQGVAAVVARSLRSL